MNHSACSEASSQSKTEIYPFLRLRWILCITMMCLSNVDFFHYSATLMNSAVAQDLFFFSEAEDAGFATGPENHTENDLDILDSLSDTHQGTWDVGTGQIKRSPVPTTEFVRMLSETENLEINVDELLIEAYAQTGTENGMFFGHMKRTESETHLTFFKKDILAGLPSDADKMKITGLGENRMDMTQTGSEIIVGSPDSRVEGHYSGMDTSLLKFPDSTWLSQQLQVFPENILEVVAQEAEGRNQEYVVTVRRIIKLGDKLSGAIRLYIDPETMTLRNMTLIGRLAMSHSTNSDPAIIKINLRFVWNRELIDATLNQWKSEGYVAGKVNGPKRRISVNTFQHIPKNGVSR